MHQLARSQRLPIEPKGAQKAPSLIKAGRKRAHRPTARLRSVAHAPNVSDLRRHRRQLDVLRVECTKCDRRGRYSVARLIEKYGRNRNMMKWREMLNADCPKRDVTGLHDRCHLVCPNLPKVL